MIQMSWFFLHWIPCENIFQNILVWHFLDFIWYLFSQKEKEEFITNTIFVCLVSSEFQEIEVDPAAYPNLEGKLTTLLSTPSL